MANDLIATTERKFRELKSKKDREGYNFRHFHTGILVQDGIRTFRADGICAGETAPDFELPTVDGGATRLSGLRGKPVLLHFGSFT